MKNVTLQQVANEAGVSLATASAAMRGEDIVRPTTREKVEKSAKKMGYRRNSAATVLASHRNKNSAKQLLIVWLTARASEADVARDFGIPIAAAEAKKYGLQFKHYNIDRPKNAQRILREIDAIGCDGLILGRFDSPVLPPVIWKRFSVISILEDHLSQGFDIVRANQFRSDLRLYRQLRKSGYKRIGICRREHPETFFDDDTRRAAALNFSLSDLPPNERLPILQLPLDALYQDTEKNLINWVKEQNPDVIVGFNHLEWDILTFNGFSIPQDLAFVALHVQQKDRGKLAGLVQNRELIPEYAVRVLMEKMRHSIRGLSRHPQETVIKLPILAGTSCPGLTGDSSDWIT